MAKPKLEVGSEIDGFRVGEVVHKGGMAHLYAATHPRVDGPVLLKVPRLGEGADPAAIVGFEMEQMILPRLSGPHVPRVFGVGDFDTTPYVAMEHIPGGSLLPLLDRLPLEPEEVARIGAAVATALDAVHVQDVIHLDIKPSNILFRPSGEAVLVDYGLAHHARLPDLMAEEFRLPYGTAPYMAPEQVMGVRSYRRSDLFALGAMMYFFATGTRPFGDPQSLKGLKERLWRDPVPPRKLNPNVPAWLQEVILHCLEPEPDNRPPTAAQLAFKLRHPDQIALTPRAERLVQDGPMVVWRRRRRGEVAASAKKLATQSMLNTAPIILVAIDLALGSGPLGDGLRTMVRRAMEANPKARLACLNVLKLHALRADSALDEEGHSKHVQRLVELRYWAEPMGLPSNRVTFHVIEAVSPAEAILEYARTNRVDHVIMGARADSLQRRLLGSVSAEVAAHAPCTVTVVRVRGAGEG